MKNVTPHLTVTCFNGEVKRVHAAKPYSNHPSDYYLMTVIHFSPSGSSFTPFVIHTLNLSDGGFSNGHYCSNFEEALAVFNACN